MNIHSWVCLLRVGCLRVVTGMIAAAILCSARAEEPAPLVDESRVHWSESAMSVNSAGQTYRGPWGNQPVALTLEHLPEHHWVRVRFDLYVIGSWDGSSPVWGPDLWSMSVRGAQRLIFASFCAWGYSGNDEQSYPDDFPHAIYPAWTGATQHDNVVDIKDSEPPKNGVYPVDVLFPHTADRLVLDFAGCYQDPPREQQLWGIGNLKVTALPEQTPTDAAALPGLWAELSSDVGPKGNTALWRFVGAGAEAVSFIKEKVDQIPDGSALPEGQNLRLHRAHRIVRIIGGEGTGALCFRMDQLSEEYAKKYGSN